MSEQELLDEIAYLTRLIQGKPVRSSRSQRQPRSFVGQEKRSRRGNLVYRPQLGVGGAPPTAGTHQPVTVGTQNNRVPVGGVGESLFPPTRGKGVHRTPVPVSRGPDSHHNDLSFPVTKGTLSATVSMVPTTPVVSSASQQSRTTETVVSRPEGPTRVVKETSSPHNFTSSDRHHHTVNSRNPLGLFVATVSPHRKRKRSKSGSSRPGSSPKKPRFSGSGRTSAYVWPPRKSPFKWRRTSAEHLKSPRTSKSSSKLPTSSTGSSSFVWRSSTGSVLDGPERQSVVKPRRPLTLPTASSPSAVSSRYKWRRMSRLGSQGSRTASPFKPPISPMVARSRYQLMRTSLLHKYAKISARKKPSVAGRPGSVQRLHTRAPVFKLKPASRSRNRVWVAQGASVPSTQTRQVHHVTPVSPRRRRSRAMNLLWVPDSRKGGETRGQRDGNEKGSACFTSLRSGGRFVIDSSGKRMKRLSSSTYGLVRRRTLSVSGATRGTSVNRLLASRVLRRSKVYVWHAKQKHRHAQKQYCVFFNRFGTCKRMDSCPFIHDPDRVALCTKFLRGTCQKLDGSCPFSHKTTKEKMPVCSFFLSGRCTRENCPYLHVSVGKDAELCPDFLKGYCSKGEKCTKQHLLKCPEFSRTGRCPRGKFCPLRHQRKKTRLPLRETVQSTTKEPHAFKRLRHRQSKHHTTAASPEANHRTTTLITPGQLEFIPLEPGADFISL